MRPFTAQEKEAVRRAHPTAPPDEIDRDLEEYERLVALMFQRDPDRPSQRPRAAAAAEESLQVNRLAELHRKLFNE